MNKYRVIYTGVGKDHPTCIGSGLYSKEIKCDCIINVVSLFMMSFPEMEKAIDKQYAYDSIINIERLYYMI